MKIYQPFNLTILLALLLPFIPVRAQEYKLRQTTNMMGMKTETTVYVKGMRKRTEGGAMMGIGANIVTIEQCDLQRTVKFNDKKKLYYIEPFGKDEEVIDEDVKPTKPPKPMAEKVSNQKGGVIYMYYNISDTGERKKMYGMTARHVWTTQKMKPSPDACAMKDSMIIKTDGWYIDLPQFNCPVRYRPEKMNMQRDRTPQPDCRDRFVTRRSGKGKLGFPLQVTTTFIMGNQPAQQSNFETSLETLEFSAQKLDSMLFEIPPGYKEAKSEEELQDKMDLNELIKQAQGNNNINMNNIGGQQPVNNGPKQANTIRIGVYAPTGSEEISAGELQQYLAGILIGLNVASVAVSNEAEARSLQCDYTLSTEFTKIKSGSKVGGLIKAIKNTDPNAASSYAIEAGMKLVKLSDGSIKTKPAISGKYEGKINDAARKALDDGGRQVLSVF